MGHREAMAEVPRMEDTEDTDTCKVRCEDHGLKESNPTDDKTSVFLYKEAEDTAQNYISANDDETTAKCQCQNTAEQSKRQQNKANDLLRTHRLLNDDLRLHRFVVGGCGRLRLSCGLVDFLTTH